MGNDVTVVPAYIDTAAVSVVATQVRLRWILWDAPSNGNTLVVHDASGGDVIFQATYATGDPRTLLYNFDGSMVDGIYVTTLGGGTVLISYSPRNP